LDYANDGLLVIYITDSGASNYSDMKTSNSGVGKYCVKKMVLLIPAPVNKPVKFEFKTKHIYIYIYVYIRTGMYHILDLHFTVKNHRSIIQWNHKKIQENYK